MSERPKKRSVTIKKHSTSVTLEDTFWTSLNEIAGKENKGINQLITEIDENKNKDNGLASAVRVFTLNYYKLENKI
tara:strand:- start:1480 stop:1707 length:228 start_codon:yes stop_codon:yes gene_type:complete